MRPFAVRPPSCLRLLVFGFFVVFATAFEPDKLVAPSSSEPSVWVKLVTEPSKRKQDDVHFLDAKLGFYVNGEGKIFKTLDGGESWSLKCSKPGTYFRTIGVVDENFVLAGNIGTEYFPDVTDTTPLYLSRDGGESWQAAELDAAGIKGLCAIDVLKSRFIDAGVLAQRTIIHAAGRVGGPAFLLRSLDGGKSWKTIDMNPHAAMILDLKFFDEMNGLIFAASDANVERSHALILSTHDGGLSWSKVYESTREYELTWKASFPSRMVGYVTIQNYNPEKSISQRVVVKTLDGGKSWQELPLVNDFAVREFGIGFVDEQRGWVGTTTGGYETKDGGTSWQPVEMGRAVNKIRIVADGKGFKLFAIGLNLYRLTLPGGGTGPRE